MISASKPDSSKGKMEAAKVTSTPPDASKETTPAPEPVEFLPIVTLNAVTDPHAVAPAVVEKALSFLKEVGAQSPDAVMASEIAAGKVAVSLEQGAQAALLKAQAMADRAFVEAYNAGDARLHGYMACLNAAIVFAAVPKAEPVVKKQ
jgi:hypothetical protein